MQYTVPAGGIGAFSIPFTLSSAGITQGFPPVRSSAWLPDTDGTALSAAALYRWINEGLDVITGLTEGIRDITGIPSTAGQAQYQLISNWRKIDNQCFDGWPMTAGQQVRYIPARQRCRDFGNRRAESGFGDSAG